MTERFLVGQSYNEQQRRREPVFPQMRVREAATALHTAFKTFGVTAREATDAFIAFNRMANKVDWGLHK